MRLLFALLLFTSCLNPVGEKWYEKQEDIECESEKEPVNMGTDIAPMYGLISQSGTPQENIGVIDNLIDGSESTVYGFRMYASPIGGALVPWVGEYRIDLQGSYRVETIRITRSKSTIISGGSSGWITRHTIYISAQDKNGSFFTVGTIMTDDPDDNTFTIAHDIKNVYIRVDGDGVIGRAGSIYGFIHNIYIDGVARTASGIKIKSLSGVVTIAKNTEIYGLLRYKAQNGIESLAIVETNDAHASNIRIRTPSGIKALAKI